MSEITMNRPVTMNDVAAKLGKTKGCVSFYLCKTHEDMQTPTAILVRKTAEEMGYGGRRAYPQVTCSCGKTFEKRSWNQTLCPECGKAHRKEQVHVFGKKYHGRSMNYSNGNFKTREEEIARMLELRGQGYSNKEIAKKIGRDLRTVIRNIGSQDPELTRQNRTMAAKIRSQKNAARKQYVTNKPIREYNKRVEAHNKMKAELNRLQVELLTEKHAIEQAAKVKVDCPALDLQTLQPTALM